jgi:hypothetical protein
MENRAQIRKELISDLMCKNRLILEEIRDSCRDQQEMQYQNKQVLNGTVPMAEITAE